MFDIQGWLNDAGIPYWTSGKNVSHNWTTISCPICSERSNHGGFAPGGERYSCFKCGAKMHVTQFIKHHLKTSWDECQSIFRQYSNSLYCPIQNERTRANSVVWPPVGAEQKLPSIFAQYLYKRDFIPSQIEALYGVKAVYLTGDFKYRLVVPIYQNGQLVTYVGRDVTGKSDLRYKNLKEELSVLPAKACVYNLDAVNDTAIIVEGITDVWRLRYNTVAMLGLVFTKEQVSLLSKKLKRAILCYDSEPEAQEMAKALAEELSFAGVNTELLTIDAKDPGELSEAEADEIRKLVF